MQVEIPPATPDIRELCCWLIGLVQDRERTLYHAPENVTTALYEQGFTCAHSIPTERGINLLENVGALEEFLS